MQETFDPRKNSKRERRTESFIDTIKRKINKKDHRVIKAVNNKIIKYNIFYA